MTARCIFPFLIVVQLTVALVAVAVPAPASSGSPDGLWSPVEEGRIPARPDLPRDIVPLRYQLFSLDGSALRAVLQQAPREFTTDAHARVVVMTLPMPDGSIERFRIVESPIMEPDLARRFPEIRTYSGQGIDDPTATTRFDLTPAGFHAIILSARGTFYIDPYRRGDTAHCIVYDRRDYVAPGKEFICLTEGAAGPVGEAPVALPAAPWGSTLRTYRLALAATVEYTAFCGGTVPLALAAMTSSVNRVDGIYEREVAVRLVLIAGEASIIYTISDPYTNGSGPTMLGQNQANLDIVIGSSNYDIGHVFSTGGGGVAVLHCVCQAGIKAEGVTGSSSPVGDAFDVDYVAHEMGHQFGGNHTFNGVTSNCGNGNRNALTAYEPGSGSTIMAYAGICGAEDLQPHSDDYFHTISFDEITTYIATQSCSVDTATGNSAPTINAGVDYTIPAQTPFALTASGGDPNGDSITYCWEEFDKGTNSPPNTDNGNRPIFRSFNPTTSPTRTFPKMSDILGGSATTFGEAYPTTTRNMNFRVTARDNRSGGGGVDYDTMIVHTVNTGAGFRVTSPNTAVNWGSGATQTVTWNVAGSTANGINATTVDILLSTDSGSTFPYTLSAGTANDGSESVTLPNVQTTTARVKVQAVGNIFFDISDTNFTLSNGGCGAITLSPATLPAGTTGTPYAQAITASGGTGSYTYTVTAGTPPTSVGLSTAGLLSGTPTAPGIFSFTVQAMDSSACTGTRAYAISVSGGGCPGITIQPATLPDGTVGSVYSQLITASGGTAPYSFGMAAGSTPPGISLSADGTLSGPPSAAGDFEFTVYTTDHAGCGSTQAYTIHVESTGCTDCPTITSIRARSAKPGSSARIRGTGFSATSKNDIVMFGSYAAKVRKAKTTQLTVVIPKKLHKGDTVNVTVTVNGKTSSGVAFTVK